MGIIKAFSGAIGGTFADQWRDIISVDSFSETIALKPGVYINSNNNRGSNIKLSEGVISNGSKIYVPENTLAVVFDSSGIEGIITEPGGYEYRDGEKSILAKDSFLDSIVEAINLRFDFGGQPSSYKRVVFMNLRELRNIKYGTSGPVLYHDNFYDTDLEVMAHGIFSIQIVKPVVFIQNYLPTNDDFYDFSDINASMQLRKEISQSLAIALNRLSKEYRVSDLPSQINRVSTELKMDVNHVGSWEERYGIELVSFVIENVTFSDESRELVRQYSSNKMSTNVYEDVSKRAADIAFQQSMGKGIAEHGLGDGGGMVLGMNLAQGIKNNEETQTISMNEQIEIVKHLKELLDAGALTEKEFEIKKKEVMGL